MESMHAGRQPPLTERVTDLYRRCCDLRSKETTTNLFLIESHDLMEGLTGAERQVAEAQLLVVAKYLGLLYVPENAREYRAGFAQPARAQIPTKR